MAEVTTYREEWRGDFERLNREWIETWFTLEEADRETFRDPLGKIIAPGGQIFFVVEGAEVLGTCAVVRHRPDVHEIAKMAVAPVARGRGYGDLLMEAAVASPGARGPGAWSSSPTPSSRPPSVSTRSTASSACLWTPTSATPAPISAWSVTSPTPPSAPTHPSAHRARRVEPIGFPRGAKRAKEEAEPPLRSFVAIRPLPSLASRL